MKDGFTGITCSIEDTLVDQANSPLDAGKGSMLSLI